jgi:hypothetical protein
MIKEISLEKEGENLKERETRGLSRFGIERNGGKRLQLRENVRQMEIPELVLKYNLLKASEDHRAKRWPLRKLYPEKQLALGSPMTCRRLRGAYRPNKLTIKIVIQEVLSKP